MNCEAYHDWLLARAPADLAAAPPHEMQDHLRACPACAALPEKLRRLELAWRALPIPPEAHAAQLAFLHRYTPAEKAAPTSWRRRVPTPLRWAAAAVVLIALGVGAWLLFRSNEARADQVLDGLVEWNVALAQLPAPAERQLLFTDKAAGFQKVMAAAALSSEDKALADWLMANGAWLAANDDPVAEADRFSDMADKLMDQLRQANEKGNAKDMNRFARHLGKVGLHGIDENMDKAKGAGKVDAQRKRKLEKLQAREALRWETMEQLLDQSPPASYKELRRALEESGKYSQPKGKGKLKGQPKAK